MQGAIFRDPSRVREGIPESGWVTADEYLSGNVREKLHTAQKAAEADAAYVVNVSALEQVQPAPVEAGDIEVHLGATWIPVDVVKDFMVELLEPSWNAAAVMEVIYVSYTGQWNITNKAKGAAANVKANETYGTERINGFHILEASLNMRTVKVYDTKYDAVSGREIRVLNKNETILAQQKQDAIKQAFRDWLFKDPARRERLVKLYNEKFNCLRGRMTAAIFPFTACRRRSCCGTTSATPWRASFTAATRCLHTLSGPGRPTRWQRRRWRPNAWGCAAKA